MIDLLHLIYDLQKRILEMRKVNVSYEELGDAKGFHYYEISKNRILDYANNILEGVISNKNYLCRKGAREFLCYLTEVLNHIESSNSEIRQLVHSRVHNTNYPNRRNKLIIDILDCERHFYDQVHPLDIQTAIAEL